MLTTSAPSVAEGDAGQKALTFTLTLSEAPTMEVVVNYQTLSSGTAKAGDDFVVAAGTVTFAAGQRTATVSVNVLGDTAVEGDETVQVQFSGSRLVASVTATGTIANDDTANAPVGAVTDGNAAANSVAENAVVGTVVGVTASATDATAGEKVTYALTSNPGNLFAIDAATGVVTVAGALDFETATSHSITVQATSSDGSTQNANFTVGVTNVAEAIVLTAGVDNIPGSPTDDTITAVLGGSGYENSSSGQTWTKLDSINGGAGSDTMNVLDVGTSVYDSQIYYNTGHEIPAGTVVTSVETMNIRAAFDVGVIAGQTIKSFDVSGFTGLTGLNVTQAVNVNVTAGDDTAVSVAGTTGSTTLAGGASQAVTSGTTVTASGSVGAVTVSGVTGDINIDGGTSVTVTDAAGGNNITIGHQAGPSGAVIVTDNNLGTSNITIDGGNAVTVTASKVVANGSVTIGGLAAPAGAITVTTIGDEYNAAQGAFVRGAISTTGGSTVTISQTATSSSAAAATDKTTVTNDVTQGAVTVTGGKATTSVTVNQSAAVTAVNAVTAVAGVRQVDTVTSIALATGEDVTVGGLTFTAGKALTAAEVAAAFANLSAGATGGSAPASNGTYSGTFGAYSTGAVTTANSVSTFAVTASTAATGNSVAGLVSDKSTNNIAAANKTAGVTAVAAVTGVMGVIGGAVTINGAITGADVLTTVSLDGYGAATVTSDALTNLSLANSAAAVTVTNNTATTLNLSLNKVTSQVVDGQAKYTTLNVTATGADSATDLVATAATTLNVAGDKALDLTTSKSLAALKTVTVTGAAGLTLDASGATVTAVSTAATTGNSTLTVDADKATFTGGNGKDTVTLSSTTVDKAVSLGGGDDSLTLATGTTAVSSTLSGGAGTDTLVMAAADAAAVSGSTAFGAKIDGFEKLQLGAVASGGTETVDLANLDGISYVVSANAANGSGVPLPTIIDNRVIGNAGGTAQIELLSLGGFGQETVLSLGQSITINGVTVTATSQNGMTGAEVGLAFDTGSSQVGSVVGQPVVPGTFGLASQNQPQMIAFTLTTPSLQDASDILNSVARGGSGPGSLTLDNMANGGTLELTDGGAGVTVTMEDATGAADSFNIITKVSTADRDFGTVDVQDVETVNITATDTNTKVAINLATLALVGDAKTVVVTGNGDITLTSAITALKTVDASVLTGDFTFSSGVNSATVTGGSGDDLITGTGNSQILTGGLGDDTLVVTGNLARLTGGAGQDVFNVGDATSTVNHYATITDLAAGDAIKLSGAALAFASSAVALADTASFQDYANAAIAATGNGEASWFQFAGNTYVVENVAIQGSNVPEVTFTNGQDIIVRITGLVDLSTSGFNTAQNALLVV